MKQSEKDRRLQKKFNILKRKRKKSSKKYNRKKIENILGLDYV